jgi:dienelactone hydrolase
MGSLNFVSRCGLYRRMPTRAALLRLFPPRQAIPPKPRVLSRAKTEYGSREVIDYAVAPGERIRAFLLVPGGSARRRAGILASHQHAGEYWVGKSEPAGLAGRKMYHYGVELCRRGYLVLCPDHLGFEERYLPISIRKDTASEGREQESLLFANCLLHGSSLTAKYLFDMLQAFDVLAADDRVDPDRLGVVGHSLGGQTALWHAFYDKRVRVAFASCGFSTLASVQRHRIPHNLASYLPGLLQVGDIDDAVACIAPRAFGMSHGTRDPLFPMEGVRHIQSRARRVFPEHSFLSLVFRGSHSFPSAVKRSAYAFLRRHLET